MKAYNSRVSNLRQLSKPKTLPINATLASLAIRGKIIVERKKKQAWMREECGKKRDLHAAGEEISSRSAHNRKIKTKPALLPFFFSL